MTCFPPVTMGGQGTETIITDPTVASTKSW
jgi:hypothetical protein